MYHITHDRSLMDGRIQEAAVALALTEDETVVAEIAIEEHDTCPPHLLGSLPPKELAVTRLTFEPHVPNPEITRMVTEALATVQSRNAEYVRYRVNPEFGADADRKRSIVASAGMELFCEKHGLELDLADLPDPAKPGALDFVTLDDLGDDAFAPVIARIGLGTLDRNDGWFHERAGADNWARVFLSMCSPSDRSSWLMGIDGSGDPIGFVGVSEMRIDHPTQWDRTPCGTITMTGVVPEHRGKGHIGTILRAGISVATERGFTVMLDSVDVLNTPMLAAMTRHGYRTDSRPWHDWFFRAPAGGDRPRRVAHR